MLTPAKSAVAQGNKHVVVDGLTNDRTASVAEDTAFKSRIRTSRMAFGSGLCGGGSAKTPGGDCL